MWLHKQHFQLIVYLSMASFLSKSALGLLVVFYLAGTGCSTTRVTSPTRPEYELNFLQEYIIPNNTLFKNTMVGGLSGIDYDSVTGSYFSISDDRSDLAPARFYIYDIRFKNHLIDSVLLRDMHYLRNQENQLFPPFRDDKPGSVDPEALRVMGSKIFWSDEGLRDLSGKNPVLITPRIFVADREGNYEGSFTVPDILQMHEGERGPRNNGGFEGLAISPDGKYLFASVEEPLINDGPRAGLHDSSGIVRLIKFDIQSRKAVAQYAYQIEPVAHPVIPENGFRVNGISDILFLNHHQLLVIERSYSTGRITCTIKVFIADLEHAEDVSSVYSLSGRKDLAIPKKLLLNMDDLKRFTDNIEGVTFGPTGANGDPTLIFISDNNFNPLERTQLLLFELKGK